MRSILLAACLFSAAAFVTQAPTEAASTSGTITLTATSAAVGVGYTWGNGVLHWNGHTYGFAVKGLNVAAVGYSKVVAHGVVHHLKHLHDFDGTYGSSTGEATLGNGIAGQALANTNGVEILINGTTRGAKLSGSVDGIQLTLNH